MPENYQVGECSCADCQSACRNKPGWFRPEQIAPLAAALGLTPKELFDQHLQVDWWVDDPNVFTLSPRLSRGTGGSMMPYDSTGVCHWFREGKCEIHALGKPAECQQMDHNGNGEHESTADAWRAPEHQEMIRDLYGSEPYADEPESIFDIMAPFLGFR